ncbi:hypothetical protein E2C01_053154 [Portunus trituberculatus]|uniref:Uncharacterized protein n=1 Tax=Portunus trituberculatus TaxID=210409 RepID=A0A5B7GNF2_PORTR|nr:hypothetical protein [Portunus trituberculatus]
MKTRPLMTPLEGRCCAVKWGAASDRAFKPVTVPSQTPRVPITPAEISPLSATGVSNKNPAVKRGHI